MNEVIQYVTAVGVMTLVVRIVFDWLKGRVNSLEGLNDRYVMRRECLEVQRRMDEKFNHLERRLDEIVERLQRFEEKIENGFLRMK